MSDPDEKWNDKLMVHDWPEHGPGALEIEALYQMFKDRMWREWNEVRVEAVACTDEDAS